MTIEELAEKLGITLDTDTSGAIGAYVAAQTAGLKANRDEARADVKKLKSQLKAFEGLDAEAWSTALEELDIDPADVVERLRAQPKADQDARQAAEAAAETKYKRQMEKAAKDRDAALARAEASDKARCDAEVQRQLTDEIAKKKGIAPLLLPALRGQVKAKIDEDGRVQITVLAPNGEEMSSDAGASATISDLVESFRRNEVFGQAFEADGGGSGAGGSRGGPPSRAGGNPFVRGPTWNLTEQANLRASNPALADRLKQEAARAGA
jgi:hypothetical protein